MQVSERANTVTAAYVAAMAGLVFSQFVPFHAFQGVLRT
jgi:hypothetical protein